jgi:hypothetical protein
MALFVANGIEPINGWLTASAALLRLALFSVGSFVAAASVVFPRGARKSD